MLTRIITPLAITCTLAATALAADSPHDVINRWTGSWTGGVAGADVHIASAPNQMESAWTLDNHFIQGTNSAAGKPVGVWLMRYNDKSSKYEVYFFAADGTAGKWTGTWSDADNTMNWSGDDVGGAKLTGWTKIAGDKQEWKLEFNDNGKVRTETGSLTRKK